MKNEHRIEGDVVWVKLTQGKETCVDLADWPLVSQYRWFAQRPKNSHTFYAVTTVRRRAGEWRGLRLHQLLLQSSRGIDHEDRNGLNNVRGNLRRCTQSQNLANTTPRGNSGFKGVYRQSLSQTWMARIGYQKTKVYLGTFETKELAARAYDAAAAKFYGEFARLNFP